MKKALIVVDVLNDFITGSLPVPGAEEIIGPIVSKVYNCLNNTYNQWYVFFTACRHPLNHCSFLPKGKWPVHGVIGTWGAEFHPALEAVLHDPRIGKHRLHIIYKGEHVDKEEYDVFEVPTTELLLNHLGIKQIEICGLARNYCVKETYEGAIAAGFNATILEDLCRGIPEVVSGEITPVTIEL